MNFKNDQKLIKIKMYLLINIECKKQTLKVDYSLNIKNRRLNTFTINIY